MSKWAMPFYLFNGPVYPAIVSGCGYATDLATATCLYREAMGMPYLHLEACIIFRVYYKLTPTAGEVMGGEVLGPMGREFTSWRNWVGRVGGW